MPISLEVACGVCTGFAIIATMFRLLIRFRRSRLWIDDVSHIFNQLGQNSITHNLQKVLATISACALLAQLLILFINPGEEAVAPLCLL